MHHPQTNVPPKTEVLFARSGHPQRGGLTLVVRLSSAAVEVLSVDDDQVEALEVKVVVLMPFLGGTGTSPTVDSPAAQNMTMIH